MKRNIWLISGLIALSGACAQVQTTTEPSRTDIIASCIRGFHNDLVKLEQAYPQINGIAKTRPGSNTLSFANGEIKGTKKEITSYSHPNACIIYLSISDRKGISEETISQREMVLPHISASETWTLLVNPEGERTCCRIPVGCSETQASSHEAATRRTQRTGDCPIGWPVTDP